MSDVLIELRYQAETRYRYTLYKKPEFPFLQSIGVKHIFHFAEDTEYGTLGTLHLQFVEEQDNKYWKGTWYDNQMEVIALAQSIQLQKEKLINEDAIINAQIRYMNKFIPNLDDDILYS